MLAFRYDAIYIQRRLSYFLLKSRTRGRSEDERGAI